MAVSYVTPLSILYIYGALPPDMVVISISPLLEPLQSTSVKSGVKVIGSSCVIVIVKNSSQKPATVSPLLVRTYTS